MVDFINEIITTIKDPDIVLKVEGERKNSNQEVILVTNTANAISKISNNKDYILVNIKFNSPQETIYNLNNVITAYKISEKT